MPRNVLLVLLLFGLSLAGCAKIQPIVTPQEYEAACRRSAAGADSACAGRVCAVFQAVTTDYHEDMAGCRAACKERAGALAADVPGSCLGKVNASRDACLEFCQRKFYRCNCAK